MKTTKVYSMTECEQRDSEEWITGDQITTKYEINKYALKSTIDVVCPTRRRFTDRSAVREEAKDKERRKARTTKVIIIITTGLKDGSRRKIRGEYR